MNVREISLAIFIILFAGIAVRAEDIAVATWNIEYFNRHFLGHDIATSRPSFLPRGDEDAKRYIAYIRECNDKDNWETAQVILDAKYFPDVLCIEEGCTQANLDTFTKKWLDGKYATDISFTGNTEPDQNQSVCMLVKNGFKVLDRKDQYYKEKDPAGKNDRGERLFARGPAFLLVESPSGYRFWIGANHQKSKYGNSVEVTKWRNREAEREHQIIKELEAQGPKDVIFLGDMNDELGYQEFEQEAGGDAIETVVGPKEDGVCLLTRSLAESGAISYHGYWKTEYRSLIDHAFATASMNKRVKSVEVFHDSFTAVASDHFPVLVHFLTSDQ